MNHGLRAVMVIRLKTCNVRLINRQFMILGISPGFLPDSFFRKLLEIFPQCQLFSNFRKLRTFL